MSKYVRFNVKGTFSDPNEYVYVVSPELKKKKFNNYIYPQINTFGRVMEAKTICSNSTNVYRVKFRCTDREGVKSMCEAWFDEDCLERPFDFGELTLDHILNLYGIDSIKEYNELDPGDYDGYDEDEEIDNDDDQEEEDEEDEKW